MESTPALADLLPGLDIHHKVSRHIGFAARVAEVARRVFRVVVVGTVKVLLEDGIEGQVEVAVAAGLEDRYLESETQAGRKDCSQTLVIRY